MWLIILPVIAILSGGLVILLAHDKLRAAKYLAGRLTIGLLLTLAAGLIIAAVGKTFSLSAYISSANPILTHIAEPIIRQATPAVGNRLAFVSGLLALVTGIAWIVLRIVRKRKTRADLLNLTKDSTPINTPNKPTDEPPTE